jgi:glycerol-3-phosphate dehydrogenase
MNRDEMVKKLEATDHPWDLVVIGGGASGLGIGLEAVTRRYRTVLLDQHDFSKGTSSRSTKLVHGGVRYLAQGNVSLVMEALRERGLLRRNAPHLVKDMPFVVPCYRRWEVIFYTIGLTLYDLLAGRYRIGRSVPLSRRRIMGMLPTVKSKKLRGGLIYYDGQFDDSRLAINLCQSFCEQGGTAINYVKVTGLLKENGKIAGVSATDLETNKSYQVRSKTVINATGIFVNDIIQMDDPEAGNLVVPSQGIHLVVDRKFLHGKYSLMIPKTPDGRVLFAVPWHNKVVMGTTDVEKKNAELEPEATEDEINYILETAGRYFEQPPAREDILSVFAGLRPLAAPTSKNKKTKEISRGHKISTSGSGLVTLTGGKWTTCRKIGEDVINHIEKNSGWTRTATRTKDFKIHGYTREKDPNSSLSWYGSDAVLIRQIINESADFGRHLSNKLPVMAAQVILAVRHEMARTVEDVLARRTRALQLDASESIRMAPAVADLMAQELGKDLSWQKSQTEQYKTLARKYLLI